MSEDKSNEPAEQHNATDTEAEARRQFLKTVGKGAVAAPAVALLLSRSAKAGFQPGSP
jgi:hypothetical protein